MFDKLKDIVSSTEFDGVVIGLYNTAAGIAITAVVLTVVKATIDAVATKILEEKANSTVAG